MRRAAKVDSTQSAIVDALRAVGAEVLILSGVGNGCPDIAAGWRGVNFFLEIKDGALPPSHRRLTPEQERWHARWRGQVAIVVDVPSALRVIGAL